MPIHSRISVVILKERTSANPDEIELGTEDKELSKRELIRYIKFKLR